MTHKKERIIEGQTPDTTSAEKAAPKKKSKRRSVPEAQVYIQAGYNNTIVTITEGNGNVLCWASAGSCGFKGARKSTPYAGQIAAEAAAGKAKVYGVERVHAFVRGAGPGRDQCLRGLINGGLSIESITDVTGIAHNGCRQPRPRRV